MFFVELAQFSIRAAYGSFFQYSWGGVGLGEGCYYGRRQQTSELNVRMSGREIVQGRVSNNGHCNNGPQIFVQTRCYTEPQINNYF